MALMTKSKRIEFFKYCGLGEYNAANILKLQKKYFPHYTGKTNNWDSAYGKDTENLLKTIYNCKKHGKNFKPEEFKCGCGGKHCCGYPSYMKAAVIANLQKVRDKYGIPITVTCGLRCAAYNKQLKGSVGNSKHLTGKAVDFYQRGTTDNVSRRKMLIAFLKTLKNHSYSYGNGVASNGTKPNAPNMGNAVHTDVK